MKKRTGTLMVAATAVLLTATFGYAEYTAMHLSADIVADHIM